MTFGLWDLGFGLWTLGKDGAVAVYLVHVDWMLVWGFFCIMMVVVVMMMMMMMVVVMMMVRIDSREFSFQLLLTVRVVCGCLS